MRILFYHASGHWSRRRRAPSPSPRAGSRRGASTVTVVVPRRTAPRRAGFAADRRGDDRAAAGDSVSRDAWRLRARAARSASSRSCSCTPSASISSPAPPCGSPSGARSSGASRRAAPSRRRAPARRRPDGDDAPALHHRGGPRARRRAASAASSRPLGVDVARARRSARDRRASTLGIEPETQLMVCVIDQRARQPRHHRAAHVALLAERHPEPAPGARGSRRRRRRHAHARRRARRHLARALPRRARRHARESARPRTWAGWRPMATTARSPASTSWRPRVPVIAERSPLVSHYVPDGIAGVLLPAG